MIETIIVVAIVVIAGVLVTKSIYKDTTGKSNGCSCGDSCRISGKCDNNNIYLKIKK